MLWDYAWDTIVSSIHVLPHFILKATDGDIIIIPVYRSGGWDTGQYAQGSTTSQWFSRDLKLGSVAPGPIHQITCYVSP